MKAKFLTMVLLFGLMFACGCNPADTELTKWGKTSNYFSFLVERATIAQQTGLLNETQIVAIDAAITQGDLCLKEWKQHIDDANYPSPDVLLCVDKAVQQVLLNLPLKGE
jgi:hypothetical protein